MATCKDCFHNEACVDMLELMGYIVNGDGIDADKRCNQFIHKSYVAPVVHGLWLTWEEQFPGETPKKKSRLGVFCSACHNHADNMFDFCPNCGAKMDGEDEPK